MVTHRLFNLVKDEVYSFDRYISGQLIAIDRSGPKMITWTANKKFTFAEWIEQAEQFASIKVEGLEDNDKLKKALKRFKVKDLHLFYSPNSDYSFGWHDDTVDVVLYVLKGRKKIQIRNRTYHLKGGDFIFIPKGHKHRVFNFRNTWALSIGLK